VVCGGTYDIASRYVAPTVLKVSGDDVVMAGETFGPILMCAEVDSMLEACKYVAAKDKPLALYLFSQHDSVHELVLQNTSSGGVTINGTLMHVSHPNLPFGGVGASGKFHAMLCLDAVPFIVRLYFAGLGGGYHGRATFDAFTHYKPVLKRSSWYDAGFVSDLWVVYAPWGPTKLLLAKLLL
jgi:hypothetical protein